MNEIYKVNKYGAIDPEHIAKIEETIQELIEEIRKIREDLDRCDGWFEYAMRGYYGFPVFIYHTPLKERIKKLELLTKANDYEYKTTTETKLVKKPISNMTATEAVRSMTAAESMKANKNK